MSGREESGQPHGSGVLPTACETSKDRSPKARNPLTANQTPRGHGTAVDPAVPNMLELGHHSLLLRQHPEDLGMTPKRSGSPATTPKHIGEMSPGGF